MQANQNHTVLIKSTVEQANGQERRSPSVKIKGHIHSQAAFMSSLRAFECQPLRIDQAKSVPGFVNNFGPCICATITERPCFAGKGKTHTLRLKARKHIA